MSSRQGVVCGPQRGRRTPGIARVALQDVGQNGVVVRPFAAMREFESAPLGAGCGASGHEDLHVRVWGDDRADVAAVENGASRPGSEGALRLEQRLANARHGRDHRSRLAHLAAAQHGLVEIGETEPPCRRDRGAFVVEVAVRADQRRGGRAIKKPGIEMRQAVARGETPGDGALA